MATDDRDPTSPQEELLRANRALDEQVKTLVKTEQRFFQAQRTLARRNARLDALNRFAVEAAELPNPHAIFDRAAHVLFSVFALDRAVGFLAGLDGKFVPLVARSINGDDAALDAAVTARIAPGVSAVLPAEVLVGRSDTLRARPELTLLFDEVDHLFPGATGEPVAPAVVVPISRDGGAAVGAMVFVRLTAITGYHEELPTPADAGFIGVIARLLAANVNNVRLVRDLKVSYDRLAQAQRELVDRERLAALGEFAAVVAHEVRNPLGAILNVVSMLRRHLDDPETLKMIHVLGEESYRLDSIVSDLIDFARPNPPQLRLEQPVRIAESALESLRVSNPTAKVSLVTEGALPEVLADSRLLRQAIFNLVLNAVQASGEAAPIVVRVGSDPQGRARIAIEDRGPGVPREFAVRIFEPFFTTKAAGTGLGLSVVKRVIDAHGGSVAVAARDEGGSVFTLTIPAAQER